MTLLQFRDILLTADPKALHYKSVKNANYTRWWEYGSDPLIASNDLTIDSSWHVQVDRFTKIEYDPMVDTIREVLSRHDIDFMYHCDFDQDSGYIHHIFDCEVL